MIAWFVKRQFALETPLLNLRTFSVAQFRHTMVILFIAYFLFLGLELLLPMYTQQVLLVSAMITGLVLMPASVAEAVFAPIFGIILDKKGGRPIALFGMSIMLISMWAMYFALNIQMNPMLLSAIFACFAISIASAMTLETHELNHLPKALIHMARRLLALLCQFLEHWAVRFLLELPKSVKAYPNNIMQDWQCLMVFI